MDLILLLCQCIGCHYTDITFSPQTLVVMVRIKLRALSVLILYAIHKNGLLHDLQTLVVLRHFDIFFI